MGTPLRSQSEGDGSFYVLGGEVAFYLEEGQLISASAGSFVNVPGGASHVFRLDYETTRILNVTAAPRERYFRATGEPPLIGAIPPEAPPTREKIGAAVQEYEVEYSACRRADTPRERVVLPIHQGGGKRLSRKSACPTFA